MIGLFARMFGRKTETDVEPRLTSDEAEGIARAAAVNSPLIDELLLQGIMREPGRVFWRFRTPTFGSWLVVDVDDASGQATVREMIGR